MKNAPDQRPPLSPLEAQLLDAARIALALIKVTWPCEHGQPRVGEAWGALERAIKAAKTKIPSTTS